MTEYPTLVQIETSAFCNASCGFCPHSSRELGASVRMTEEMFSQIINEISLWQAPPNTICPFLTNEPFADARIYDFCRLINEKLPKTSIVFYTNGSLFTERNIEQLRTIKNIYTINLSLHHSNPAEYEAELKIPWPKTIESMARLINANRVSPITREILILRVGNGDSQADQKFMKFCAACFPGTTAFVAPRWNWKGSIQSHMDYRPWLDIICPRQNGLCILATGRVALCCMDQNGEYPLGDLNNQTLLEVFNADLARKHRTTLKRHLVPCNKCSMHG